MIELLKKTMFTGLGVASLTKEKIEDIAQEFVKKGEISEVEGKKLVTELMAKSEESKEDVRQQIDALVKSSLDKLNLAKSSELEELKEEVQLLRKSLEKETGETSD